MKDGKDPEQQWIEVEKQAKKLREIGITLKEAAAVNEEVDVEEKTDRADIAGDELV